MQGLQIFNFSTFVSALALLIIVYTITDVRYHFRLAITPIPLISISFILLLAIGFGTLIIDAWFIKYSYLQPIFGLIFLILIFSWIAVAFITPWKFSKINYKKYYRALYQIIAKGSADELPIIAEELERSVVAIIQHAKEARTFEVARYAQGIISLIGNRKFCHYIISSSPKTAACIFDCIAKQKIFNIPLGQFAKNITIEAINNNDSFLYHEDNGYRSGLLGYLKPFSRSIYGNYELTEAFGTSCNSTLDIHYEIYSQWDAEQLRKYCGCVILVCENYIQTSTINNHSTTLARAFDIITNCCADVYKLNNISSELHLLDAYKRLEVAVCFFKQAIELIDKRINISILNLKISSKQKNLYNSLAESICEIIEHASLIKTSPDNCWMIQHNIIWTSFFWSYGPSTVSWKIIRYKLRRLLYEEVCQLNKFPNFKSAHTLGFLLNIMGFGVIKKDKQNKTYYALRKVVLKWVQENYLHLTNYQIKVAEACLTGNISFDKKKRTLVRIVHEGLQAKPSKEYLEISNQRRVRKFRLF